MKIFIHDVIRLRPFSEISLYKASQIRNLVLYASIFVFKDVLEDHVLENILTYSTALSIFENYNLIASHGQYADNLLVSHMYGQSTVSFNFHGLLHLYEDVLLHGKFSMFVMFQNMTVLLPDDLI